MLRQREMVHQSYANEVGRQHQAIRNRSEEETKKTETENNLKRNQSDISHTKTRSFSKKKNKSKGPPATGGKIEFSARIY